MQIAYHPIHLTTHGFGTTVQITPCRRVAIEQVLRTPKQSNRNSPQRKDISSYAHREPVRVHGLRGPGVILGGTIRTSSMEAEADHGWTP